MNLSISCKISISEKTILVDVVSLRDETQSTNINTLLNNNVKMPLIGIVTYKIEEYSELKKQLIMHLKLDICTLIQHLIIIMNMK